MPYIGNQPAPTNVGSSNITDGSIVNADVNASAAIALSKISGAAPLASPTFTGTATAPTVNASTALQVGGAAITSTPAELNLLDGSSAGSIVNSKGVVYGSSGEVNATTLQVGGTAITSTPAELNVLDGIPGTLTATELGYVDGVTSALQTQLDAKQALDAELTELATMGSTTAAALADLTEAEVQILDGATVSTAELNKLDGYTGAVADLNRVDVTTEGLSEASKVVTADSNGVVSFDNGTVEESTAITSSSNAATINLRDGNVFTHTLSENVTYTFSNPAASGRASAFILKITQDSSARTITWPSSVDWAAATAPTITATNAGVDVFGFMTVDGGTTYYGFTLGQALG